MYPSDDMLTEWLTNGMAIIPPEKMQQSQSRGSGTIKALSVKRVQEVMFKEMEELRVDFTLSEWLRSNHLYRDFIAEQFGNDFYNSNKLVVIYDIEKDTK